MAKTTEKLLSGVEALTSPDYAELNTEDRLLHACLCAYAKHHLGNEDITWNELGKILKDAICEKVGDNNFIRWMDSVSS